MHDPAPEDHAACLILAKIRRFMIPPETGHWWWFDDGRKEEEGWRWLQRAWQEAALGTEGVSSDIP